MFCFPEKKDGYFSSLYMSKQVDKIQSTQGLIEEILTEPVLSKENVFNDV